MFGIRISSFGVKGGLQLLVVGRPGGIAAPPFYRWVDLEDAWVEVTQDELGAVGSR